MRIILKIIAAPFMVVLTIMVAVLIFLFSFSEQIFNFASGLLALIGIALMVFSREWFGGGVFLGLAFLVSPVGLPAIASWLIEKLDDLKYSLRDFITS